MPDVLSDADVGLEEVLSDADVGIESPKSEAGLGDLNLAIPRQPPSLEQLTTYGGGRKPVASYGETMESIRSGTETPAMQLAAPRPVFTEPRIDIPDVPIDEKKAGFTEALIKESLNAVAGVPEFFSSDAGILALLAGKLSPRLTSAGFATDLTASAWNQAKQAYKDWGQMTPGQKGIATAQILSTLIFGGLAGTHAAGKIRIPGFDEAKPAPDIEAATVHAKETPITQPAPQIDLTSAIAQEPAIPIERPTAPVFERPTEPTFERPGEPTFERPVQPEAPPQIPSEKGRGPYRMVDGKLRDADGNVVDAEGNIIEARPEPTPEPTEKPTPFIPVPAAKEEPKPAEPVPVPETAKPAMTPEQEALQRELAGEMEQPAPPPPSPAKVAEVKPEKTYGDKLAEELEQQRLRDESEFKRQQQQGQRKPTTTLPNLVKELGRQKVDELIGEWEIDAKLSPDGKSIIGYADPRNQQGKMRVSTKDFLNWYETREARQQPTPSPEPPAPKPAEGVEGVDIVPQSVTMPTVKQPLESSYETKAKTAAAKQSVVESVQKRFKDPELEKARDTVSKQSDEQYYSDENKIHERTAELIHKFVKEETGTEDPAMVVRFYAEKYGLETPISFQWDDPGVKHGDIMVKYDVRTKKPIEFVIRLPRFEPNSSTANSFLATIRHEIEHAIDIEKRGYDFLKKDPANRSLMMVYVPKGETIVQSLKRNTKGHHRNYEHFELDFLREVLGKPSSELNKPTPGPAAPTVGETKATEIEGTQGALATPRMVPSAPVPTPPSVPIKAVSQIIRDLSKGLDVPIRFGRLTTTKYAGYFKKIPNLIGSKRANNLPVVSHEVGHKLDSLYRISSDPTLAAELNALGDPAQLGPGSSWTPTKSRTYKLGEGVAEFIRQWIDDPTRTSSIAPNMHRYFESLLNSNHDMGRVLRQAQENVRLWKTAPPLERLDSSIVRGEGPVKSRYTASNLTRDLVDDLHFLDLAVTEAKKTTAIPASKDPYILARLLRGTFGMADTFIRKGVVDFKSKGVRIGSGLEDILKPVSGRINDFRRFIIAKRAKELMDQGKNTGLQPGDVAEALRVYQNAPEFQATFDKLKGWNDALLQYALDAGMLKPETVSAMRQLNQDYVPFHRFFEIGANELNAEQGSGVGRGLNVGTPGSLKRLKGSNRDIVDPLETMVRNAYAIITASEKNAVNVALADLANKPNMGRWVERVKTPIDPHKVTMADIRKRLETMGADVSMIPDDAEFTFFRRAGRTPYGENIIKVVRNGDAEYYRVNGDLYETFHALDYDLAGKFIRLISQPAQLLRAGVTLAPDFALRNALRDTFSSAVISKYTMLPFLHTTKGVMNLLGLGDPKIVSEWAASGGRQAVEATYFDAAKIQKFLRDKITKEQTTADKAKNVVMSPLVALRRLSGLLEEGTRVAQYELAYKKLRSQGVPEGDARRMAAFEARDLQDFAKGGANTKPLRMMAAFWNAALQGNVRLAQSFRDRPVSTISKGLAFITIPKLIEQAINWNNDDYWDRPQWERDLFFMFPYGKDENQRTKFIRVPVPFEVGVIFGSLPGRIVQWAKENRPEAMTGFPELMLKQTVPNPTPQWLLTLFELAAGKQGYSLWRGRPIVPTSLADEPPELRHTEQTSLTAKKIGQTLGVSPAKVDYAIQGTTGGIGRMLTHQASDRMIEAITGEKRTAQGVVPGSSFVTTPAGVQSDAVERFYRALEKSKEDLSRHKGGKETTGEYRQAGKLDAISKQMSALRRKARESKDPVERQRISLQIADKAKKALETIQPKQ